jgi:transcriptional regulator of acetoin/glycerol metabolism
MGAPIDTRSSLAPRGRPTSAQLREARRTVLDSGGRVDVPLQQLDPRLARSWLRSSRSGLTPEGRSSGTPHASATQLARALDLHREFVAHAGPVMEYLFEQTRDSGSMVILADARGMLLHALGDLPFMDRAERVALRPGANWHEQVRGTNAIGTALADRSATVVRGAEHYLERNAFLACAAAPILDPAGQLLGVLDISGEHRSAHPHTLGLARAGARMIEQRLFDNRHHAALRLRFHRHAEGIATLTEGQLAVSTDGWVMGANAVALDWLGLRCDQINGVQLDAVFDLGRAEWTQWLHSGEREPRRLASRHHGFVWARVDSAPQAVESEATRLHPLPALASLAAAAGQAGQAAPAGPQAAPPEAPQSHDALATLDLGDAAMQRAVERARRLRDSGIPLLLQGESGAGKETFARAWHASGERRAARFVVQRCAGHVPGSFAAALQAALTLAEGGTLFLDEVGELDAADQWLLLRCLTAEGSAQGSTDGSVHDGAHPPGNALSAGTALVCGTRRRLAAEVSAGRFREDLYYRLNGLLLPLPPLRERQDLPALARHLLQELAPRRPLQLAAEVLAALPQGRWVGNLRQLANALRTAVHLLEGRETQIGWQHLPDDLVEELQPPCGGGAATARNASPAARVDAPGAGGNGLDALEAVAAQTIERVIAQTGGNLSEAARRLGISRNTLYRHLRVQQGGQ